MNLRSIFLALAKSGRVPATPSEASTPRLAETRRA